MKELINSAIMRMVNDGTMSINRINNLIYIKEFIDRISTKKYIEKATVDKIKKKYGVSPTIITWGDYFQTEMATSLMILPDDEFQKAVDTVRFDMMASHIIFSEKDESFMQWVDETHKEITRNKKNEYTDEEMEILHLRILMDYYLNIGIVDNFSEAEIDWYSRFREAEVG